MLPARLAPDTYKPKERLREEWANATRTCEHCGKVFGRADKPKMIYGAFMRLRFCGYACSQAASRTDHVARFWEKVRKTDECWLWTGGTDDKGYGVHHRDGRKIKAHRYSYELHKGALGHLHALHSCDNPSCVNPDHLRAGTHQENMDDRERRGRGGRLKGARHGSAKLSEAQVRYILESQEPGANIARRFGVSKSTIYAVRKGTNWKSVR